MIKAEMLNEMNLKLRALLAAGLITAREPVKTCSEAECFHNKPPAMRVVGKCL